VRDRQCPQLHRPARLLRLGSAVAGFMAPEDTNEATSPRTRTALQVIVIVVAVAAAGWLLFKLGTVVLLLVVAASFAYVVAPLVRLAEQPIRIAGQRRQLSRGLAIGLVYVVILGGATAGTVILLPTVTAQLGEAVSQAPVYAESFRVWAQGWSRYYEHARLPAEVRDGINRSALQVGDAAVEYARGALVATSHAKNNFGILVTEKGHIKRIPMSDIPVQGRGGQGVQLWKVTKVTGMVSGFAIASGESGDVDVYTERGKRLRLSAKDIPETTRASKGADLKQIIKAADLFGGENVAGVTTS